MVVILTICQFISRVQMLKMIKIYIPLADGQAIMSEVLRGVVKQTVDCCIIPITSKREKNHYTGNLNNWITALELCEDDYFIGMDSDVVLNNPEAIETLLNVKDLKIDIAGSSTQEKHYESTKEYVNFAHSLLYCKNPKEILKYFKKLKKQRCVECCWCKAITMIIDSEKIYRLYKIPYLSECERIEIIDHKEVRKKHCQDGNNNNNTQR